MSGTESKGEDSKPEVPQAGSAADPAVASTSAAGVGVAPVLVDARVLASILNQAKGPILTRIRQLLAQFTGDGSVEVTVWLAEFERLCELEKIAPTEILMYMLGDNAARVYSRMRVAEASQWDVVKAALTAEYAMPRQEAWRRFVACKLEVGDTVDVYLDRLERFGGRLGMSCNDLSFRAQFYEGLPASVYEWAITHESAYTADFGTVLARVRDRLVSRRAVAGHAKSGQPSKVVAAASGKQQQQSGSGGCYRCGGAHKVKDCTERRKAPTTKASKRAGCFRCGSTEHFVRNCTSRAQTAAAAGEEPCFQVEGADRGGASSTMETE
jgi:hypothetical protein